MFKKECDVQQTSKIFPLFSRKLKRRILIAGILAIITMIIVAIFKHFPSTLVYIGPGLIVAFIFLASAPAMD